MPKHIAGEGPSPLSKAVVANGFVFVSGQVGRQPDGSLSAEFGEQLRQALGNVASVLQEAGSGLDRVIKLTAYVTSDGWDDTFNLVYAEYFHRPFPARTRVGVARLALGCQVEIDVIAVRSE